MRVGLGLVIACVVSSCGYRVTAPNARLPGGIVAVQIPLFQNRTAEPNFEAVLTEAFREHYARAGLLGDGNTEAHLEGTILSVSGPPTVTNTGRGPTYRLYVTALVKLTRGPQVLKQAMVTQSEDFPSGADLLLTEANRGSALRRMAELVARDAAEQLETP
jgi:hypothetical protein